MTTYELWVPWNRGRQWYRIAAHRSPSEAFQSAEDQGGHWRLYRRTQYGTSGSMVLVDSSAGWGASEGRDHPSWVDREQAGL